MACGGTTGIGIDNTGFTDNVCTGGTYHPIDGVTASPALDYLELRQHGAFVGGDAGGVDGTSVAASGTPCKTASNPAACSAALASLSRTTQGWQSSGGMMEVVIDRYLVYTRGDEVGAVTSLAELTTFLMPVDTVKDAALVVSERGHRFDCGRNNAKKTATGFELITNTGQTCGPGTGIDEHVVSMTFGGAMAITQTVRIKDGDPNCAIGRRPEGFVATRSAAESALGAYFAEMAELEAASVYAFEQLGDELCSHGAPMELVLAARAAARDEVRHTRTTARIAMRFGAATHPPRVDVRPGRSLLEIAIENATEGCVRETFGALQATYQSKHAADPAISRAMRVIAEDETRHAALAWDLAAWIEPLLSPGERARVEEARRGAVDELGRGLAASAHPDVTRRAGVPSARSAAWLLDQVKRELWAA